MIYTLLSSPLANALLNTHPNDPIPTSLPANHPFHSWWNWASSSPSQWTKLFQYYTSNGVSQDQHTNSRIPADLAAVIDAVKAESLSRQPVHLPLPRSGSSPPSLSGTPTCCDERAHGGMSPKKAHEVHRMAAYVAHLLDADGVRELGVRHVVDVGAGQAYLSHTLTEMGFSVLALDSCQSQLDGAVRRGQHERRSTTNAPHRGGTDADPAGRRKHGVLPQISSQLQQACQSTITYRMAPITADTLLDCITEWVANSTTSADKPLPILLVGLHACGSLAIDILRALLASLRQRRAGESPLWNVVGAVVVGCCYNLMRPEDFPLSKKWQELSVNGEPAFVNNMTPRTPLIRRSVHFSSGVPVACTHSAPFRLPTSSFHLASQVPSEWHRSEDQWRRTKLAVRKIAWRGVLEALIRANEDPISPGKLGRLNDAAYQSWDVFLQKAGHRMGISFECSATPVALERTLEEDSSGPIPRRKVLLDEQRTRLERQLEVLHVLRCLLGTVVESWIILDRSQWLKEELESLIELPEERPDPTRTNSRNELEESTSKSNLGMDVELVNLFDQGTGSGRNVAIVVRPRR